MKLSTSYLSIQDHKEENIKKLMSTTTDYLHVDIMDGHFVPNKTEDNDIQVKWLKNSLKPLDIHLMVENVDEYIEIYQDLKPSFLTFHVELEDHIDISQIIKKLHRLHIGVGLSLKPGTSIDRIKPYLNDIDLILLMSVEPGKGGQEFLPSTIEKINQLKQLQTEYSFMIEVDGGINKETSYQCFRAGVDMIVVGSYITTSDDYQDRINTLYL